MSCGGKGKGVSLLSLRGPGPAQPEESRDALETRQVMLPLFATFILQTHCISFLIFFFFFFNFWPCHMASGILAPRPGITPTPLAVKMRSPNHWITREFPHCISEGRVSLVTLGKMLKETLLLFQGIHSFPAERSHLQCGYISCHSCTPPAQRSQELKATRGLRQLKL